jgi:hypothetical protein
VVNCGVQNTRNFMNRLNERVVPQNESHVSIC